MRVEKDTTQGTSGLVTLNTYMYYVYIFGNKNEGAVQRSLEGFAIENSFLAMSLVRRLVATEKKSFLSLMTSSKWFTVNSTPPSPPTLCHRSPSRLLLKISLPPASADVVFEIPRSLLVKPSTAHRPFSSFIQLILTPRNSLILIVISVSALQCLSGDPEKYLQAPTKSL